MSLAVSAAVAPGLVSGASTVYVGSRAPCALPGVAGTSPKRGVAVVLPTQIISSLNPMPAR